MMPSYAQIRPQNPFPVSGSRFPVRICAPIFISRLLRLIFFLITCMVKSQSNMASSGIEVRSLEKGNRGHVVLPGYGRLTDLYVEILK